jgi:hypothetical protein
MVGRAMSGLAFLGLLAGCVGSQQSFSPTTAASSQRPSRKQHSWIKAGASEEPLVYVGGVWGSTEPATFMLSYPDGEVVGMLDDYGRGMCSDAQGNVYLTHENSATEYAHGGTTPLRTLRVPGSEVYNCAVDPTTGDVALTLTCPPCGYIDIAIFPPGSGKPLRLNNGTGAWTCGYDASGNLFVNSPYAVLSELPKGSSDFHAITLDQQIGAAGQVQWDGSYMTLQQNSYPGWIYRFTVSGSTAHVLKPTKFTMNIQSANASWIYGKSILIPFSKKRDPDPGTLGIWPYPKGRRAIKLIKHLPSEDRYFGAVTVSAPPSGTLLKRE